MYKTILRLAWPYLLRYLARHSADYLAQRRERKRQQETAAQPIQDLPPAIVAPVEDPAPQTKLITVNAVWYILGGVVLGSAIGLILAQVFREET
jgi:hypothetical protein